MDEKEAAAHFWIKENTELNIVENGLKLGLKSVKVHQLQKSVLRHLFDRFSISAPTGNWDKVYKRFLTLFGKLGDDYLERQIPDLLVKHPSLRGSAMRYYLHFGFTGTRYRHIRDYLEGGHCIDDVSVFAAAKLVVEWKIPYNSAYRPEAIRLAKKLIRRFSPFRFASGLWILAKYAGSNELGTYVVQNAKYWRKSGWAGRQVAAVWPLLTSKRQAEVESILSANGLLQGLQVLAHIRELYKLKDIDQSLEGYLTSLPTPPYNYSLQKSILAVIMLSSELNKTAKRKLWTKIKRAVSDPAYLHKLSSYKPL